jgi:predicted RNA-binding protein with PIN domain
MPASDAELQRRAENRLLASLLELAVIVAQQGSRNVPRVEPPAALKPFLGFANHIPPPALRAARRVLDTDHVFREQLANAATSELVGEAASLFAQRPPGWEMAYDAYVAEAIEQDRAGAGGDRTAKKLAAVEETLRKRDESLEAARGEIVQLRAQLLVERRERSAATGKTSAAELIMQQLRGQVTQLEDELYKVQELSVHISDERDALAKQLHELGDASRIQEMQDAALIHLRRAIGDLHDAFGSEPVTRAVPVERVTTQQGSLSLPAKAILPSKSNVERVSKKTSTNVARSSATQLRRKAVALPSGIVDDSIEAAQFLLRLPNVIVLIDGYNVAKLRWGNEVSPGLLRERLIAMVLQLSQRTNANVQLVFDGTADTATSETIGKRLRVVFTPMGQEADDRILALLEEQPASYPIVVVSSDRRVADGSIAVGAQVLSSFTFTAAAGSVGPSSRSRKPSKVF